MNYYDDTLQPLIVSTPTRDSSTIQTGNSEPLKVVFRRPDKQYYARRIIFKQNGCLLRIMMAAISNPIRNRRLM